MVVLGVTRIMINLWRHIQKERHSIFFDTIFVCHIIEMVLDPHLGKENDRNLTWKVHLKDLFKLQDIYHYDLMYFNYEFDAANFYISGFE